MSIDTEIKVAACHLHIETIVELRRRALSGHISIAFSDDAVTVQIHELILQRIVMGIILLLISVVGIRSISHHLTAKVSACSLGDRTDFNVIVIILCHIKLSKLSILECTIESDLNAPWSFLHRYACDGKLQSFVADGADIGHELVAEARAHRHLDGIQKVFRIAYVSIYASAEPVIEEAEVGAYVICGRSFPSDGRVIRLRREHVHEILITHVIHVRRVVGHDISCHVDIVPYSVLLAGLADGESELKGRHLLHVLEKRLMGDVPCECSRWEESPSVVLGELAGAVATGCECEHISGVYRVVHPAVERHQIVLVPIHEVSRVHCLTRIEVRLMGDVEVVDAAVRLVVVLPRVSCDQIKLIDAPRIVVCGIRLQHLASGQIVAGSISADSEIGRVGVGLE